MQSCPIWKKKKMPSYDRKCARKHKRTPLSGLVIGSVPDYDPTLLGAWILTTRTMALWGSAGGGYERSCPLNYPIGKILTLQLSCSDTWKIWTWYSIAYRGVHDFKHIKNNKGKVKIRLATPNPSIYASPALERLRQTDVYTSPIPPFSAF